MAGQDYVFKPFLRHVITQAITTERRRLGGPRRLGCEYNEHRNPTRPSPGNKQKGIHCAQLNMHSQAKLGNEDSTNISRNKQKRNSLHPIRYAFPSRAWERKM